MRILMVTDYETAKTVNADITIEAEYGDMVVEGKQLTLAHHGPRRNNHAPCNVVLDYAYNEDGLTILVSHLDLDTIGGIAAVIGRQGYNNKFWEAAEYVDVHGPHHIHKFPERIQDKLNAYWSWCETQPKAEKLATGEVRDVTEEVNKHIRTINTILAFGDSELIIAGREWAKSVQNATEEKLVYESDNVRAFVTDGVFCNAAYYSEKRGKDIPCTVSFNTKYKSITVAFFDGGALLNACEIVQNLWGKLAGGHAGIAGSPREKEMNILDLTDLIDAVEDEFSSMRAREMWKAIGRPN